MKHSVGAAFATLNAAFKKLRVYFVYALFILYFVLRILSSFFPTQLSPGLSNFSMVLLFGILLQLLFEIHTAVTAGKSSALVFDTFIDSRDTLLSEITKLAANHQKITIRYLGLVGYHWQDIEPGLTILLTQKRAKNVLLDFVFLDTTWSGVDVFNPTWRNQGITTCEWINFFQQKNRKQIKEFNWNVEVNLYRSVPQIWGVCVNDTTLFLGAAYWDQVEDEESIQVEGTEIVNGVPKLVMRGGSNPMELIRSDDGRHGEKRIKEFIDWFEYFKHKKPLPTSLL